VTQADHRAADEKQAAYFRHELDVERRLLLSDIGGRRALIDRPGGISRRSPGKNSEAELRHIDWLIAQLDSRFAPNEIERD
jgi:hypothetical protein